MTSMLSISENVFFVWLMGGGGQVGTAKQVPGLVQANFLTQHKSCRRRNPTGHLEFTAGPKRKQLWLCTRHTLQSLSLKIGGGSIRRVGVDPQLISEGFRGTEPAPHASCLSQRSAYSLVVNKSCEMPPTFHVNISNIVLSQDKKKRKNKNKRDLHLLSFKCVCLFITRFNLLKEILA